jgi:acetoin utilization protein AcuC
MPVALLYHENLRDYDFGPGHSFRGDRFGAFFHFLKEHLPENGNYRVLAADPATEEDLALICHPEYVAFVTAYYRTAHAGLELPAGPDVRRFLSVDNVPRGRPGRLEEAARLVVGQARLGVDLVLGGAFGQAVSVGGGLHHARRSYGEGFCIYNDVAFAALYAVTKHGLERVLVLDTDAHAGNGTAEYFYGDPRVLFVDLHQDPRTLYPGTGFVYEIGTGPGRGYTVNCPLPPGAGWDSYRYVFEEVVWPLAEEFRPQLIIRNGGCDPYWNDRLTWLGLTAEDFRELGALVRDLAGLCGGRELDLICSGYNERALPACWLALMAGVAGLPVRVDEPEPVPRWVRRDAGYHETRDMVRELKKHLKDYWSCMAG